MASRSLRGRLAWWVVASTTISLLVFAATAFTVVWLEERHEQATHVLTVENPAVEATEVVLSAMAMAAPLALLLSVGGALWLSRRALAPIDAVVAAAGEMSADQLHRRLPVPPADDELRALVLALNQLFERLEHGFAALARYAGDASHELRTPLAVMAMELEVALRHPRTTDEWQHTARTTLDEMGRMTRLVEGLLELARAGAGAAAREPVDVREVVEQVIARSPAADGRQLAAPGAGAPAWVLGHGDALGSALHNLVANALRYTPAGGQVAVRIEAQPDRRLVHVDDSGPGVAAAERASIFAPFARGAAGKAAGERGLGLGLAIARRVIELHGGVLSVADSPLGGARFTVSLPAAAEPALP